MQSDLKIIGYGMTKQEKDKEDIRMLFGTVEERRAARKKARRKAYYALNGEREREAARRWKAANRERANARQALYRANNQERIKEYQRRYRAIARESGLRQ